MIDREGDCGLSRNVRIVRHPSGALPNLRRQRSSLGNAGMARHSQVPYGGIVNLVTDFTDPAIRGMSVFHCHLLSHEDKGMMAKLLFELANESKD